MNIFCRDYFIFAVVVVCNKMVILFFFFEFMNENNATAISILFISRIKTHI